MMLLSAMFFNHVFAQGWAQRPGEGYFKIGHYAVSSGSFYGPGGTKTGIRTTGIYSTGIYAEYGLANRFTAIANVPFFVRNTLNKIEYRPSGRVDAADISNTFGDTDIGLKYGLIADKPVVVSTTLLLGLPTGNTSGGRTKILQSGDGEFNQMLRTDISTSVYSFYFSLYGAFNNRTRSFSDEVRYGFDLGYQFKKLNAALHLNAIKSLKNGGTATVSNGIFSNNLEYISPSLELSYLLKGNLGVSVSGSMVLSGSNVLDAPGFGGGIYYLLKKGK